MDKLLEYFNGDELAASVWKSKYAIEGEETPTDMHMRMAKEFSRIEAGYFQNTSERKDFSSFSEFYQRNIVGSPLYTKTIFEYFDKFKYICPQGSIMAMLGNKYKIGSLSNCFVIGQPEDSYGGIMMKDEELVQLMKRRGGVGIDLSTLRPELTTVSNAAGSSTGMASFMHRYSGSTREVAQNGRRGALMISCDIRHPDSMQIILSKRDLTKVTGANVSLMLRDDFMQAVSLDADYWLRFPCNRNVEVVNADYEYNKNYSLEDGTIVKKIKAREYFDALVESNWMSAEPGSIFIDRHWNYSPDGVYSQYRGITTNPCGEIFMPAYDACRLLAINYLSVIKNAFKKDAHIDEEKLYEISYIQQRLADDIVDLEIEHINRIIEKIDNDPEDEETKRREKLLWQKIRQVAQNSRRTGCGFTALGDAIAALGFKYDSKEAKEAIETLSSIKMRAELDCTIDMAIERGSFEGWNMELEFPNERTSYEDIGGNDFYTMLLSDFFEQAVRMMKYGRRNVSWSTAAPTGSLSLLTQSTSGIEPLFMAFHIRRKKVNAGDKDVRVDFVDQNGDSWMEYPVLHPQFAYWLQNYIGISSPSTLTREEIEGLFKESPWNGSQAEDIDWIERVEIQSIVQKYTTHSISSTINLPEDVTKEKISEIYIEAFRRNLKGITIYRTNSRTGVLVKEQAKKDSNGFASHDAPKRPKELPCDVYNITAKGKRWNVIVGLYEGRPYEVFASSEDSTDIPSRIKNGMVTKEDGKKGYTLQSGKYRIENITENISDEEEALTRMISTALRHGSSIEFIVQQLNKTSGTVVSFTKAVARTLSKYTKKKEGLICSNCGEASVILEEGCQKCKNCGESKC